jgi:hypothetical protein
MARFLCTKLRGIVCTDEISCFIAAQTYCNTDPNCNPQLDRFADMNWSIAVGNPGSFPLRASGGGT